MNSFFFCSHYLVNLFCLESEWLVSWIEMQPHHISLESLVSLSEHLCVRLIGYLSTRTTRVKVWRNDVACWLATKFTYVAPYHLSWWVYGVAALFRKTFTIFTHDNNTHYELNNLCSPSSPFKTSLRNRDLDSQSTSTHNSNSSSSHDAPSYWTLIKLGRGTIGYDLGHRIARLWYWREKGGG